MLWPHTKQPDAQAMKLKDERAALQNLQQEQKNLSKRLNNYYVRLVQIFHSDN
jgi:hypothetical protein